MTTTPPRGRVLSVFSVLMGILAITNFAKPIPVTSDTGFVFFGERLAGFPSAAAGVIFGLILLAYAIGIWRMRSWALPLGWAYAAYVIVNGLLFRLRNPMPGETERQVFEVVYGIVAIGGAVALASLLTSRRSELT
ncbi:MAG: hypothetical protein HY270_22115 [Deltaproteobacteria bacterium]|nr:hypothetical protein [Deltaproteobacteria bacterium]